MLVLWENGSAPVKDLAHALQLDYGTLTPLVKRLEANGLVKRERRSDDERIVEVQLTDSGTALQDRVRTVPLMIGDAMGLDPGEFDKVDALLKRLTANVTRATARATEKAT
jgi:DNA-binding MarR family transcriptional regulator